MEKIRTPAIRFAGFTEEWEERKIFDVAERYDNLRIPVVANLRIPGLTPYYGANGIQDYVEGFTHEGEFVLVAEDGANDLKNYPVKYVKGRIWVNNHAHVLQGKSGVADNNFLAYEIGRTDIESLLVGCGRAKLNANTMMEIGIFLPFFAEQEKIGEYFSYLDHLIAFYQRKVEKGQAFKRAMLGKMFPKEGALVPEVRFAGFTGNWERRKLGEFTAVTSGFMGDALLTEGEYRITRIETIANGTVDESRVGFSNVKPEGSYLLHKGDILYSNINSINHIGKVAQYQGNSLLYHGINLLRLVPNKEANSDFLLYLLNTEMRKNWAKSHAHQAVSQASINQSLLATQLVEFPSIGEQKAIGAYFKSLDSIITSYQRKIEKLQQLKKAMLEKMFV